MRCCFNIDAIYFPAFLLQISYKIFSFLVEFFSTLKVAKKVLFSENPYLTQSQYQFWASLIPSLYWFRAMIITHLRLVRLGQDLASLTQVRKESYVRVSNPQPPCLDICWSYLLRHRDCWKLIFCPVKVSLKESNFKRESEQLILHGRLFIYNCPVLICTWIAVRELSLWYVQTNVLVDCW